MYNTLFALMMTGILGIITGATGFIKKRSKPPPKVVTPTTPTVEALS
ncbi:MAG: hypothetical protein ACTSSP_04155 [Candidatus Asgardarchaeia archaeon]